MFKVFSYNIIFFDFYNDNEKGKKKILFSCLVL